MPIDFIHFSVDPSEWGISKMMTRINQIQKSYGPKPPVAKTFKGESFQAELQKSATAPANQQSAAEPVPEMTFRPKDVGAVISATQFDSLIDSTANKYQLDKQLLKAVIKAESGFNPNAVSPKGAMGLMQLMPGTAKDLNVSDPFDPTQNVDGGARYLKAMLEKFNGDQSLALSAYNAGPKAVEAYGGIPPYDETQDYVKRVLGMLAGQR